MRTYKRLRIDGATYFFTLVTHERRPLFVEDGAVEKLLAVVNAVRQRHAFDIEAFAVLPDHLHMIWSLPDGDSDYSTRWMLIKSGFSRSLARLPGEVVSASRQRKRERAVWQRRFWEHTIRDSGDFARHVDYVHWNAVRHGMASSPAEWRHSSFHDHVQAERYPHDWRPPETPEVGLSQEWD